MKNNLGLEIIKSFKTIDLKISEYAKFLNNFFNKHKDSEIVFIVNLKGAFVFACDLLKKIDPSNKFFLEFVSVNSYKHKTAEILKFNKWISCNLNNKYVFILEDVIDRGKTLNKMLQILNSQYLKIKGLKIVSLFDKKENHKNISFKYKSLIEISSSLFVIGYGLDLDGRYRNLIDLCIYK